MIKLESYPSLNIQQKTELLEVFTDFESLNRYEIKNANGHVELYAAERDEGGLMSFLTRNFFDTLRPFTMDLVGRSGEPFLKIQRPFRFYFHEISVFDHHDEFIGSVKREFSLLHKKFSVWDRNGQKLCDFYGPLWKPWTFFIQRQGAEVGKIVKKWSGGLKEVLTDADNFGIEFPDDADETPRKILLAAVFLIDFVYFESGE